MSANTTELNSKNFNSFIKSGKVAVDFWAEWCGPCRITGPIIEEVARELKGKIKFGKVNVDENTGLAQKFRVMSIPTLIFFNKGERVDRLVGAMSKEELLRRIKENLS